MTDFSRYNSNHMHYHQWQTLLQTAVGKQKSQATSLSAYVPHGDPAKADCVIGFSFGFRQQGGALDPGPINRSLALYATSRYNFKPLIMQFEIDDVLKGEGRELIHLRIDKEEGIYLDTVQVINKAKAIMAANGWSRPLLVGHAHHMKRIDRMCKQAGLQTLVPADLPSAWDSFSKQWWTRSLPQWRLRESAVNFHYAIKGWA